MPWVVRDVVDDIGKAVGRRWQGFDRMLPGRAHLSEGCMAPLTVNGPNGRPAGLAICRHQHVPGDRLNQTRGTAGRFSLIVRLREPDTDAALDDLLGPDGIPPALDRLGNQAGGRPPLTGIQEC
jgi:hypothetical protein